MTSHLVEIEQRALQAKNAGHLRQAADLLVTIVTERPDWEHGTAAYNLAGCYEDLGEFSLAERFYRNALMYEPGNTIFLGGLASFLYLHGDPVEAFDRYLSLLDFERKNGGERAAESIAAALRVLGRRIGLSDENVAKRLNPGSLPAD